MSYSSSFPTQRPSLNLVFNGGSDQLDSRISFSRADSTPSAVHYWSNEKSLNSENLLPYSNDLSGWSSSTTTTPSTNNLAPDGTNTATAVIENTATSGHNRYKSFSSVSGTNYTFLTFAKANGRTQFQVVAQATTSIANVKFDLTAVTSAVTSGSAVSHSITAIGSTGWYKCEVTVTATGTGSNAYHQVNLLDASGVASYTGDGSSGLYLWGMQVSSTGETVLNETSGSIHRSFAPTLKSVANSGDPRFEYSPTNGQSVGSGTALGLLIESSASNLQRYGSAFASWANKVGSDLTANAAIAPNGELEATLWTAITSSNYHYLNDSFVSVTSGTTYTASVYAKDAGQRYVQIAGGATNFGFGQYATFDLQTGSVDANGVTASAESVGNGWWRIQATMTATGSGSSMGLLIMVDSATAARLPVFTADDYSGVLLFGYQFEASSAASSLVDTGSQSSALTRAADSCAVVDATLFSSGEHTIIWEGDTDPTTGDKRFFALSDGGLDNRFVADYDNGVATRLRNWADGVNNVTKTTSTVDMTVGNHKLAATLKTNEAQLVIDGARRQLDTYCAVGGGIDQLAINSTTTGAGPTYNMNGHCKRITYFNVALSQAEAEALTSNP